MQKVLGYLKAVEKEAVRPLLDAIKMQQQHDHSLLSAVLASGSGIIAVILVLFIMQRNRVLLPIGVITQRMRELAAGNDSAALPVVERDDEIAKMLEALHVFKNNAKELQHHRDHLQEMIETKTAHLVLAKEEAEVARHEAERANHLKSEFLANMSHELRTPMHAIINFSRIGIERIDRWEKPKHIENLSRIKSSGERLSRLLNDLLDLSKLEAGKMHYDMSPHQFTSLLNSVAEEIDVLAKSKSLTIHMPDTGTTFAVAEYDQSKMHQVLLNLLSNAIKFARNIQISTSPTHRIITI